MSIRFDDKAKVFSLVTDNTEYQMKVNEYGMLLHTYYGEGVGRHDMGYLYKEFDRACAGNVYECRTRRGMSFDTMPLEYSPFGCGDYRVNALKVTDQAGSSALDLRFKDYEIREGKKYEIEELPYVRSGQDKVDTLVINLEDKAAGVAVSLFYGVFENRDVITRSAVIRNESGKVISLNKAASMSMDIQYADLDLIHFHGRHAFERQPERVRVSQDIHTISSRRGASSHQHNPFFILCDRNADEDMGGCYGFMLMYSGSHQEEIERDQTGSIRVTVGIESTNFNWKLESGEAFSTPEVILSYSKNGLNGLSGLYHRIIRDNVCPSRFRDVKRPVLLNNWEGTYFDFDEDKLIKIMDEAAGMGCEMLVLDDGWFGVRNDDNSGLGDWFVNTDKLPNGMKKLADHANSLGMKFGLWFEPEMINEDSELFRNHPDWALTDPDRKPVMSRNQLVLDMTRNDVIDYLYDSMVKILDSANIEYVKWDFNRSITSFFSHDLSADLQGEVYHRFVLGTYSLIDRLTRKYPDLMIEGCTGGGGRFDAGMMFYCPQIWCSDNTDAINRLKIQKGTSYGYPVSTFGSHVSASPNHQNGRMVPIQTRAIVAMSGTFGYELDPGKLSADDKSEIKKQIGIFNRFYELIQKGDYYRLAGADDNYTSWEFVSPDKKEILLSIVITDVEGNPRIPFVKLKNLDPDATYEIDHVYTSIEGYEISGGNEFLGAALMNGGLPIELYAGVYPSLQLHFIRR